MVISLLKRRARGVSAFVITLLLIELLDEFVFGALEAGWPLIRSDLGLSYAQIGLLLALPKLIGNFGEIILGILADTWKRRALIIGGGMVFGLSLLLITISDSFVLLMVGLTLFNPASGAFVSLSQAALMDHQPDRHEQNMARWTFAGSFGVVLGSLALGAAIGLGLGWRPVFLMLAALTFLLVLVAWRFPFPNGVDETDENEVSFGFLAGLTNALRALRRGVVLRWLILLECADLMGDALHGYLALYMVDIIRMTEAEAGVAIAVWTIIGLISDLLFIPLLERMRGLTWLRFSAGIQLLIYPAFLLVESLPVKLVLLGLVTFFNTGWYAVLQGQYYSAMPGQSGTALAVGNLFGIGSSLIPFAIGLLAERFGLEAAMWSLLLGALALVIGLPRRTFKPPQPSSDT